GAYADNDAFVWGYVFGSSGTEGGALYRVTNGVATLVGGAGSLGFGNQSQCGIHVFSPSNIVVTGQSQVFKIDTVAKTSAALGTASVSQSGALWADDPNDVFIISGSTVDRWTGGPSWNNLGTGLSGTMSSVWGTAGNRVFGSGWYNSAG